MQPPDGSSAKLVSPKDTWKEASFEPDLAGKYGVGFVAELDWQGQSVSCSSNACVLQAIRETGCIVSITWQKGPGSAENGKADESVQVPDMDIHFVHPDAKSGDVDGDGEDDGFFDPKFDCFWFNPHPIWVTDQADDPRRQPHFFRRRTDGALEELVVYNEPGPGVCYRVGVHFWDDHGLGEWSVTARAYVGDAKVYEGEKTLRLLDLWKVGTVCCSSQSAGFVTCDDNKEQCVVSDYVNPKFDFK